MTVNRIYKGILDIIKIMNRLEKYRRIRTLRQRYMFSALLSLSLLSAGICTADYSINGLMAGKNGLNIVSVKNSGPLTEFAFMDQKLYINTQYIGRDFEKLKQGLGKLLDIF